MARYLKPHYSTGELGDALGGQGWKIARLFEVGLIEEPPRVAGRRLIPRALVPVIIERLTERGWLEDDVHAG